MRFEELQILNPSITLKKVTDSEFTHYGNHLSYLDSSAIISAAEKEIIVPSSGNQYIADVETFKNFDITGQIQRDIFGTLAIEIGTCTGHSTELTGMEFHQGSEVVIAVTDCVVILGKRQDVKDNQYNSELVEYFYVEKGEVIELYGTTLHYSPCKVYDSGFTTLVILLEGTNDLLSDLPNKNPLLSKKNKFLMVHATQEEKIKNGVHDGFYGDLPRINI